MVEASVDLAMTHEACVQVISAMEKMGAKSVWNPEKIIVVLDHWAPAPTEKAASMHKKIREFVKAQGIGNFYDVGYGICHQVMMEEGLVKPGYLVAGTDSHTNTSGALGAFSIGIGPTDMAAVFALGKVWLKVPHTINVRFDGNLSKRTNGKDAILRVIGKLGTSGAVYKAIEFTGQGIESMGMSDRMTITNMSIEMGAKSGIVPPDDITMKYLSDLGIDAPPLESREGVEYQEEFGFDLNTLGPQVACPHSVDNVKEVGEVKNVKIDQAFLGSCTNGRLEDLEAASEILKGETVSKDVRLIVSPASQRIYRQALKAGIIEVLIDSGAIMCNSTCAACFGGHLGILAPGEVCISTSNRNFIGRMGSVDSQVYVASPYTVAASALYGEITDPRSV
jgi:3-isopropylmalate/(R)-2-methylmalate dehydratase large subunit